MRTRMIAATLVAVAAATLTACSTSDDTSAKTDFNDADVTFAQDMIPHHRQATEMAALASTRTDTAAVLDLATRIEAAQDPEITTMTGWLKSWAKDVPAEGDDMGGMDDSSMGGDGANSMPGMMSDDQMSELKAASGAVFDQMFLTMMTEHHDGAIEMAKTEQKDGKNNDAVGLAEKIEKDQTAEIAEMRDLLAS